MDSAISKKIKSRSEEMKILTKIGDLINYLQPKLSENKRIGFVPTMGALHEGHISLITKAQKDNDIVVVSIFVNPTQFNNPEDLKNYPRTPNEDYRMLRENNVDVLFSPDEKEIYSSKDKIPDVVLPENIINVMEGIHRPGHFNGVVQIVSRLFEIVKPLKAYFGEKDFQQLTVIKSMVKQLGSKVEIVACPTIREKNGLAMSSRNQKLSEKGIEEATEISKTLFYVRDNWKKFQPAELKKIAIDKIESSGKLKVEYIEIADEETLQSVHTWDQSKQIRCFAAVFCEGVRLIDNVKII